MIEKYIDKLEFPSLDSNQIKALKIETELDIDIYTYYDYFKSLHIIIKSEGEINENRRGIKVKNEELDLINIGKSNYINFCCTSIEFKDKFIQIINEILEFYKTSKKLIKSINIIINKWYYFFEKSNSNILSENTVKGLIGELIFIKEFSKKKSYEKIIEAWKGPQSGLRDFNFDSFDIEVKASSKEIGHVHTINGQFQLKSISIPLYIYSINLKKSDSTNSISLKKLIDEICLDIGGDSFMLNDFFEKLEMLSVLVPTVEKYNDYSYELKDILTVQINAANLNDFIIENINNRISNIKYDYDFNGLTNVEIDIS